MRATSFGTAIAMAALALVVSALPQPSQLEARDLVQGCDCRDPNNLDQLCSGQRVADPDPSKPKLNFVTSCSSQCKVTVGSTEVALEMVSSLSVGELDPWVCSQGNACTFNWYELRYSMFC